MNTDLPPRTSSSIAARLPLARLAACAALLLAAGAACANDFPTVERVLYVQECMHSHPGPNFEMTNKCSCALDNLASQIKYDDYETMSTITKAISIGGERGGALRDAPALQPQIKRLRDLQSSAEKACFLSPPAAK